MWLNLKTQPANGFHEVELRLLNTEKRSLKEIAILIWIRWKLVIDLLWTILHDKFHKDILSNKNFSNKFDFDHSLGMTVHISYSSPIWTIYLWTVTWFWNNNPCRTFVKNLCQIKKFSNHELGFDRSDCMTAICYRCPISAVPTNQQLLEGKRTYVKFHIGISKTVSGYTDGANQLYTL